MWILNRDRALKCAEQTTVKCSSTFHVVRIFVDVQSTFMTADELLHKFDVFRNSDVLTDRGRPLPFGRSVTPVGFINFLQQPVHACPEPIITGKLSQQTL